MQRNIASSMQKNVSSGLIYTTLSVPAVPPTVAAVTGSEPAGSTNHLVSLGPTFVAGELILMFAASDGGVTQEPSTVASGWTKIESFGNAAGSAVFKKLAVGDEGGTTIDLTTPAGEILASLCFRIQTWSGNIADVAVATAPLTGTDATAECPALTTGWGAVPTLWIGACSMSSAVTLSSGPTNYTANSQGIASTARGQIHTAWRQLTASSETPGPFTFSGSDSWGSTTIAVRGTG